MLPLPRSSRTFVGQDCHRRKCSKGSRTRPHGACTAPPAPMYSRGMPWVNSDRFCDRTSSRFRGPSIPVTASGTALRAPEGRRRRHFGRHGTDRHRGGPYPTGVRFTRVLRLPDVSGIGGGVWATRVGGGNHALDSAPHRLSRQWARTLHRVHTDLAGIVYRGRFAGGTAVAVGEPTADAFPQRPVLSLPSVASRLGGCQRYRSARTRLRHPVIGYREPLVARRVSLVSRRRFGQAGASCQDASRTG